MTARKPTPYLDTRSRTPERAPLPPPEGPPWRQAEETVAFRALFRLASEVVAGDDALDANVESRARNLGTSSVSTEQEFRSAVRRAGFDPCRVDQEVALVYSVAAGLAPS